MASSEAEARDDSAATADDNNNNEINSEEDEAAISIEDVLLGMKYASLAITDDEPGTLKKVGKMNPWHIEALKIITGGSEEEAHKPLTEILETHMDLTLDKCIDISGMTPGGHFLDTQGYIAHNDETIVLAYRCTTSVFDWLTNFNTTSSAWEIEEDLAQGYSGFLSGLEGLCCVDEYKPRVHTGFYNNFLVSLPAIKEYIEPMLATDQPPRKLYVVGHSLGAGIATLAACYFLLEFDWTQLPHHFVAVTAGCPRACQKSMQLLVNQELQRQKEKAVFCRIVRNKDVVPTVPPSVFGFQHIGHLVHITKNDEVLMNQADDAKKEDQRTVDEAEMKSLLSHNPNKELEHEDDSNDNHEMSKYERQVARIPKAFRDHMPDFYLKPLMQMVRESQGGTLEDNDDDMNHQATGGDCPDQDVAEEKNKTTGASSNKKKNKKKFFRPFWKKRVDESVSPEQRVD